MGFREGIEAVDWVKVGLGPERETRSVGLLVRTHWRVVVGSVMVEGFLGGCLGGSRGWKRVEMRDWTALCGTFLCWNFRCDLVGNLRIRRYSSGLRGFRVFDLPPTFSFLRSSYLLDSFNPIY